MPVGVTRPAPELVAAGAPAAPARQRLERLCDPGSLRSLRGGVAPRHGVEADGGAGDGVAAGIGTVDGRPVACYSQDPTFMGGSLGGAHAETICELLHLAGRSGVPVVGFVESGGARLQEGHDALSGYGEIFRASVELGDRVPQISVVTGVSAGGGAYSPALTDLIVMSEGARMFLTGPRVVGEAMGEWVSMDELGGTGRPLAQRRLRPGRRRRGGRDRLGAGDPRYLPSRIGSAPEPAIPTGPDPGDPAAVVPDRRGASTTSARWPGGSSTAARCWSSAAAGAAA